METKINSTSPSRDHQPSTRFTVYVDKNPAADIADKFFDEHQIRALKFKCRAWSAVGRATSRTNLEAMIPVLCSRFSLSPADFELKYSRKAGCACGCSPGFVGKLLTNSLHRELSRTNVWMDVSPSEAALTLLRAECIKQGRKLPAEIAAQAAPSFSNSSSSI